MLVLLWVRERIYKRAGSEITEGRRLLRVNEDSGPDNNLPV